MNRNIMKCLASTLNKAMARSLRLSHDVSLGGRDSGPNRNNIKFNRVFVLIRIKNLIRTGRSEPYQRV